ELVVRFLVIGGHPLAELLHGVGRGALLSQLTELHLGKVALGGSLDELRVTPRGLRGEGGHGKQETHEHETHQRIPHVTYSSSWVSTPRSPTQATGHGRETVCRRNDSGCQGRW